MIEAHDNIMDSIKLFSKAGANGVTVEAMKFAKKKDELIKVDGDFCYSLEILKGKFIELKKEIHKHNMKFYSGESRLKSIGDNLCYCSIEGLKETYTQQF